MKYFSVGHRPVEEQSSLKDPLEPKLFFCSSPWWSREDEATQLTSRAGRDQTFLKPVSWTPGLGPCDEEERDVSRRLSLLLVGANEL